MFDLMDKKKFIFLCSFLECLSEPVVFVMHLLITTVVPANSDSDVILCLHMLSKTLTCTLHLSKGKLIDHLCINPILRIGLIHK